MNHVEQAAAARADRELRPLRYREIAPPVLSITVYSFRVCVYTGGCDWQPLSLPSWSADEPMSLEQLLSVPEQLMAN